MTTAQLSTATVRITHVHMQSGGTRHEHIQSVHWNIPATGASDTSTVSTMVDFIDNGGKVVSWDGHYAAQVVVVRPAGSKPYIRTRADGVLTNNLLQLPRF